MRRFVVAAGIAAGMGLAALAIARRGGSQTERPPAVPRAVVAPTVTVNTERLVKDGVVVEFSVGRSGNAGGGAALLEGDYAEVRFRLKDATSGLPLRGLNPAAWMDIGVAPSGPAGALPRSASSTGAQPGGGAPSCKDKIGLYLRGLVGVRPMIDLNSYYLLVLNQDPSLSVIDPIVSMTGKTSLYATVPLQRPAADWIQGRDTKWLYVSMPQAGAVAVVDTETFKVKTNVPAGREPTRVALQRDGRYLWVGDDAPEAGESGVTVIDTETHASVAHIPTGRGHHEIAFSSGDRYAFVNNRNEGTVSVIDVGRLAKHKEDLPTGPLPIAVASSPLSQMIYVADGKEGTITVIDGARLAVITRMQARPGLGPLRFSPDGRWGFGVNPAEHAVYVIDAAENRIVHTIAVDGAPYQVAFTRAFAYVRLLDSERVRMINLSTLGAGKDPTVQSFAAGTAAPEQAGDLSLADAIAPASIEAAVFVVNPADGSTHFYMEGMNAPMGAFGSYGHQARAVAVVDRSLKEVEPGVYAAHVRLPAAGRYDVAFLLDTPPVVHCFGLEAKPSPAVFGDPGALGIEYLDLPAKVKVAAGEALPLRFRLSIPSSGHSLLPLGGLGEVKLRYFVAPGQPHDEIPARELGDGVYEARPTFTRTGVYYLHIAAPAMQPRYGAPPYRTLWVENRATQGRQDP